MQKEDFSSNFFPIFFQFAVFTFTSGGLKPVFYLNAKNLHCASKCFHSLYNLSFIQSTIEFICRVN